MPNFSKPRKCDYYLKLYLAHYLFTHQLTARFVTKKIDGKFPFDLENRKKFIAGQARRQAA